MKEILCYGDSNTWGTDPADNAHRLEWPVRWTGVLQRELGDEFHIVEEGLPGRTAGIDDPLLPYRNGKQLLIPTLESHAPLDLVILMLGTNDIGYYGVSASDAAESVGTLGHLVMRSQMGRGASSPKLLLMCPAPLGPFDLCEQPDLWAGIDEVSISLPAQFRRVSMALSCPCMDAGQIVARSRLDGWHLDSRSHQLLGVAVAREVRALLA